MDLFINQYELIQNTRNLLFQYCESLSHEDYTKKMESFGGDSIRDLHAHVAECYQIWLGKRALRKELPNVSFDQIDSVEQMKELFAQTDKIVYEFLQMYENKWDHQVDVTLRNGSIRKFSCLWLFTHTITHEFHHKGQIVKIGRSLGYIPPDTDLKES